MSDTFLPIKLAKKAIDFLVKSGLPQSVASEVIVNLYGALGRSGEELTSGEKLGSATAPGSRMLWDLTHSHMTMLYTKSRPEYIRLSLALPAAIRDSRAYAEGSTREEEVAMLKAAGMVLMCLLRTTQEVAKAKPGENIQRTLIMPSDYLQFTDDQQPKAGGLAAFIRSMMLGLFMIDMGPEDAVEEPSDDSPVIH